MPLVTRQANRGDIFKQLLEPGDWLNGDLWSDLTANELKLNVTGTATDIGHAEDEVQTLTNKTITYGDNTISGTLAEFNIAVTDETLAGLAAANTWAAEQTLNSLQITQGIQIATMSKTFEDFFTGDSLDVIWTLNNLTGTNTAPLTSGIGQGVSLTTQAALNAKLSLTFNEIKNFDMAKCTVYGIMGIDALGTAITAKIGMSNGSDVGNNDNFTCIFADDSFGVLGIQSADGTSNSNSTGDVDITTDNTPIKMVSNGTDIRLFTLQSSVWTLEVTKTTNNPTGAGQPILWAATGDSAAHILRVTYYRCHDDD